MAASALPLQAQQESVSILRVMDGETLKIDRNGQKELIKLIGLDTPKSKMHSKAERDAIQNRQDFLPMTSMGIEAMQLLKRLVTPNVKYQERFLRARALPLGCIPKFE
jgi:endonuclease YncB( thermonuclease family)